MTSSIIASRFAELFPRVSPRKITLLLGIVMLLNRSVTAQPTPPPPTCPTEQAHAFDFLVGRWSGVVFDLKGADSAAGGPAAEVTSTRLFAGCALEERWHFEQDGKTEVDDVVLRAFDLAAGAWSYDLVSSHIEHVHFDGAWVDGKWTFMRDFQANGRTTRVRLAWVPTTYGYSEQISRSADGGMTWVDTRHINFSPAGLQRPETR
jgi:hypothetical protein